MNNMLFSDWSWRKPLPDPFNHSMVKRQRNDITSRYNTASTKSARLHGPTLSALLAYAKLCNGDSKLGALGFYTGTSSKQPLAEYWTGDDTVCVHYYPKEGKFTASHFIIIDGKPSPYQLSENKDDGTALIFTLLPLLLEDDEFSTCFSELCSLLKTPDADYEAYSRNGIILCDNIYRRILAGEIYLKIPVDGCIASFQQRHLTEGVYSFNIPIAGEFKIFKFKKVHSISLNNFSALLGKYAFSKRVFSDEEKCLIPNIEDWYIPAPELLDVCKMVQETTGSHTPMRNFMFRGPAGTGKTEAVKALAAAVGLPYMFFNCSSNTEVYELFGQILPDCAPKVDNLPTLEDILIDPGTVYFELTGEQRDNVTEDIAFQELIRAHLREDGQQRYHYSDTPLVKAMREGYVLELQEPGVISNPGVLVGLNSMLDRCKAVVLANGEVIHRHPDSIVVFTTNIGYEGCQQFNQSLISRMDGIVDFEALTQDVLLKRVQGITGFSDIDCLQQMIRVMGDIQEHLRKNMITEGSCGMRELIAWVSATMVLKSAYQAAKYTILPSISSDPDDQAQVDGTFLRNAFAVGV